MPDTPALPNTCPTCGAHWLLGEWDARCGVCEGGALSRPCTQCSGRCGESWLRMVTNDDSRAYSWVGTCRLMDSTLS